MSKALKTISPAELAQHKGPASCWIAVDGVVYDVTKFASMHPGGAAVLLQFGGKECTNEFYEYHRKEVLAKFGPKLRIGLMEGCDRSPDYAKSESAFDASRRAPRHVWLFVAVLQAKAH